MGKACANRIGLALQMCFVVCVCECVCVSWGKRVGHMNAGALGSQKTVLSLLRLEFERVVSHPSRVLGTELRYSVFFSAEPLSSTSPMRISYDTESPLLPSEEKPHQAGRDSISDGLFHLGRATSAPFLELLLSMVFPL